jgi:hypothetical protein
MDREDPIPTAYSSRSTPCLSCNTGTQPSPHHNRTQRPPDGSSVVSPSSVGIDADMTGDSTCSHRRDNFQKLILTQTTSLVSIMVNKHAYKPSLKEVIVESRSVLTKNTSWVIVEYPR